MYWKLSAVIIFVLAQFVNGTILRLNATEYSRMPPMFALDEYEPCMEQPHGMYCLIKLDLYDDSNNDLINTIHEFSNATNRHYNHTNIDRGVCVRSRCSKYLEGEGEREILHGLERCMNASICAKYGVSARLALLYHCDHAGEQPHYTTADWGFLIVTAALFAVVLSATVYDMYLQGREGNEYILSFSLKRNWNFLHRTQIEDKRMMSLQGLHGVRVIINILMITAHVLLLFTVGFNSNTHVAETSFDYPLYYVFYNGLVIVQLFFFMSGFLLVYNMEIYSETHEISWKLLPLAFFKRFMRLSPALAMMLWFTSTWLQHLSAGPLWKLYVTNSVVADCHNYWWTHLLYFNNYIVDNKFCALQTWHIAADTQLFIIGLVVLTATMKVGRRYAMMALLVLGTLAPALHVWFQDLDALVIMRPEFYRTLDNNTYRYLHVLGHNNLQVFVIGMAAARLVYKFQLKGQDFSNCKTYAKFHWLAIPAYAYVFYNGRVFYDQEYSVAARALYGAVLRLVMGAITAWMILGFVLKVPSTFRDIIESRVWVVPSRLTYSVYLVHMNLVHVMLGIRRYTSEVTAFHLVILFLGVVTLSYLVALPFYLVVEAPLNALLKVLTTPRQKNAEKIDQNNNILTKKVETSKNK